MALKGAGTQIVLNGKPYKCLNFSSSEFDALAEMIHAGSGSRDQDDRVGESTTAWETWHKGFGLGAVINPLTDIGRYNYTSAAGSLFCGVDARYRAQIILCPAATVMTYADPLTAETKVQYIEFQGVTFAIGARYAHSLSGSTWTVSKDFGGSAACQQGCATDFGGNLYVGITIGDMWTYSGSAWTQPAAGWTPSLLAAVGGNTIWGIDSSRQLKSSTDGTTWTTAVTVGITYYNATVLMDYNGFPFIGAPEGFYFYDGAKVWNALPEIGQRLNANNCKGAAVARGIVYLPVTSGVWGYSADRVNADVLTPLIDRNSNLETRGTFQSFWSDVDFLWGLFRSQGGTTYLVCYDYNPEPGYGWHMVVDNLGVAATAAIGIQASSSTPKLFFSTTTDIYYILLPQNSVNPYADTNYRYNLTGSLYMPSEDDSFGDVVKDQISVSIDTSGCAAGKTVAVFYSLDGAAFVQLGSTITSNGTSELFFPLNSSCKSIVVRIDLATNDQTLTPRVGTLARHFQLRFNRRRKWSGDLVLARGGITQNSQQAQQELAAVLAARVASGSVELVDQNASRFQAYVTKLGEPKNDYDGDNFVITANIEMAERRQS